MKESQEKARQSLEEQTKLVGEKNQLLQTVKKLNRDVAKLENFKRSLLQQLQDDDEVRQNHFSMLFVVVVVIVRSPQSVSLCTVSNT